MRRLIRLIAAHLLVAVAFSVLGFSSVSEAAAQGDAAPSALKGVHEVLDGTARKDDLGISVPIPISHPARRYPSTNDFPTGPEVGDPLPRITLRNQHGDMVDVHSRKRAGSAVVLFFRSAVW
jgi:hypothetical protein